MLRQQHRVLAGWQRQNMSQRLVLLHRDSSVGMDGTKGQPIADRTRSDGEIVIERIAGVTLRGLVREGISGSAAHTRRFLL